MWVGRSHRCPRCATLVFTADLAEWCSSCVEADKLERGEYPRCAGCHQVIEVPERVQRFLCPWGSS